MSNLTNSPTSPRVFISYSSEARNQVSELAARLVADGIDLHWDGATDGGPLEGWPLWSVKEIDAADLVLLICTDSYATRFLGYEDSTKGRGVSWEGQIITQTIFEDARKIRKFLPVVFEPSRENIPLPLRSQTYYDLSLNEGYDLLLKRILGQDTPGLVDSRKVVPYLPGETLTFLHVSGIGPARDLYLEPAERLNVITGDNGLGKTFLMECAWWALTGRWPDTPAYPRADADQDKVFIAYALGSDPLFGRMSLYDWQAQEWIHTESELGQATLGLYVRADGSYSVWDPAREHRSRTGNRVSNVAQLPSVLTRDQIWNGMTGPRSGNLINGLISDWVLWQNSPDRYPQYEVFCRTLAKMSPPNQSDIGLLTPGRSVRMPFDSREMPTIKHPYGEVPVIHASAGVRRILTLAYMMVWVWTEHQVHSQHIREEPQRQMILLIDEIEAHLHPQWQRVILPALLEARELLGEQLDIQFWVSTHSPLVTVSIEPSFDPERDKLWNLCLPDTTDSDEGILDVILQELPFERFGSADAWLTSEAFQLKQPRSVEAEEAIAEAQALQLMEHPDQNEVKRVHQRLLDCLGPHDTFWPLWLYFAEQNGVTP